MALPWALVILSLLPLLEAQSPVCGNLTLTGVPITNDILKQLTGKWFYIASAFHHPQFNQSVKEIQAAFFYFRPNYTEDRIYVKEYMTINGTCFYNTTYLDVQRENRTLTKTGFDEKVFARMVPTNDPKIYMFSFYPNDKQNMGLSIYADEPTLSQEQMQVFYEALKCLGIDMSEINLTKKENDACEPLEKQHLDEQRKKEEAQWTKIPENFNTDS